jgi:RNA-directed DNA polymerase
MSLRTPEAIRSLQRKLYGKAKAEPAFRFYLLYDKIWRADILRHAYDLARANKGAPGVDGMTFERIEAAGLEDWLTRLGEELRRSMPTGWRSQTRGAYRCQPVRRVMIPKLGGGERPLGIPTIRDRLVQTAAKLVLEPIPRIWLRQPEDELRGGYGPRGVRLSAGTQCE